ncbi:MAG TPA: Arm DNA-binding domain-containing protein [Rhodocyclaceae bacterium]|nr:Arm DNA-binding domain-containing protein [Rhodocyclaceae bacterium]
MGKLSDVQIRGWSKAGERFEQRGDGEGLYLRFRKDDASTRWLFRYRLAGQVRILSMGSYGSLSLADARKC